ncbi:MAG: carotenoid synthesis regulator CarF [Candidatus Solibacter usitatus]|nr:carotenoid synthesis regulator CarF [Candidatus Solibacter usitatus]
MEITGLPAHDESGWGQLAFEALCIAAAPALIVLAGSRLLSTDVSWSWHILSAVVCGCLFADFGSGLVHWFADTWFQESMPVLGRRLLRPFRIHHVNPDDLARRKFIDCNGDVAMVCDLVLIAIAGIPLDNFAGQWWYAMLGTSAVAALPTNQIHQWAHMPKPPRLVEWLQDCGVILSRAAHQRHHAPPYVEHYCITTGWMNRPLSAIQFFRRMETLITAVTGLEPRQDDTRFERAHA